MQSTMIDPRTLMPFFDPNAFSMLQQQVAAAAAAAAGQAKSSGNSFRIHDLLEPGAKSGPESSAAAMLAQMMASAGQCHATSSSDKANSSGENDSLLDELDGNHSGRSSVTDTPTLDRSTSSASGNSATTPALGSGSSSTATGSSGGSAGGGPMHGKKARKARTIFTDKQLQELENTFDRQKYLSVQDRVDLATRMGLSDTQVKTWYQNRRTKWKRQAAVGVDLLQEASNLHAVQSLIRTNPYWSQYIANSTFAQQRLMQAGLIPGPGTQPFPLVFPPGMFPGAASPFLPPGFPSSGTNSAAAAAALLDHLKPSVSPKEGKGTVNGTLDKPESPTSTNSSPEREECVGEATKLLKCADEDSS